MSTPLETWLEKAKYYDYPPPEKAWLRAIAVIEKLKEALEFYATFSPRQCPEGYYEIHLGVVGEGGEVKFGTRARSAIAIDPEAVNDADPTPWCSGCGAMKKSQCNCGPIAEND